MYEDLPMGHSVTVNGLLTVPLKHLKKIAAQLEQVGVTEASIQAAVVKNPLLVHEVLCESVGSLGENGQFDVAKNSIVDVIN